MTTEELLTFLKNNVPNFQDPQLIKGKGIAFHYTPHWDKINSEGFKGAPINKDLDKTQMTDISTLAKEKTGVVFAYKKLEDAKEEGDGLDIVKITYRSAIETFHGQENELDKITKNYIALILNRKPVIESPKKTILILANEIIDFEKVS